MGSILIGGTFLIGLWLLAGVFLYGMVWLSAKAYLLVRILAALGTLVLVFSLIPSLLFPRSREFCGKGIILVTYLWGASLWISCTLLVYELWGLTGLAIGLFLAGVGTVPLAFVALLLNGYFAAAIGIVVSAILVYGVRMLGMWVLSRAESGKGSED